MGGVEARWEGERTRSSDIASSAEDDQKRGGRDLDYGRGETSLRG